MFKLFRRERHPLELEAEVCANTIQHQLTRMNLAYRYKRQGEEITQRVEFVQPLIATPDELRIEVDVNSLPRSVTITDLRKPEVLETLSAACKRPMRAEHKKGKGGGFWYVVELAERANVPKLVKYSAMQRPANAAPLMLPIGMGGHKSQRWEDLRNLPHLLIAGATKQGKSVLVNAILCSLASRLGPDRLRLHLCDLKGGMELAFYEDLPHVDSFITRAHQLPVMLRTLQSELDRRTELLRGKARDIDGYNYQVGKEHALPYIVAIVDEIANAMLTPDKVKVEEGPNKGTHSIAKLSESLLADLAARARAVGIHLVISTQRPSVDVVTGLIKANFPCRIAFGTASEIDSRVIIDDSSAHGLPPGRMYFRRNMDLIELQGPMLTDQEVQKYVAAIIKGESLPDEQPETAEERARRECGLLLDLALANFGAKFPVKELAKHPQVKAAGISFQRVEQLAQRLEREKILKRHFGPRPRSVMAPPSRWRAIYPQSVMRHASWQNATESTP